MNKNRNVLYKGKWFHEMTREELIDALIEQGEAYMHQADETLRAELRGLNRLNESRELRPSFPVRHVVAVWALALLLLISHVW